MDARDRELPVRQSGGRYIVELYNEVRPHQALASRAPMAVWRGGMKEAVDMPPRIEVRGLDDASASPTCPQPQQQPQLLA